MATSDRSPYEPDPQFRGGGGRELSGGRTMSNRRSSVCSLPRESCLFACDTPEKSHRFFDRSRPRNRSLQPGTGCASTRLGRGAGRRAHPGNRGIRNTQRHVSSLATLPSGATRGCARSVRGTLAKQRLLLDRSVLSGSAGAVRLLQGRQVVQLLLQHRPRACRDDSSGPSPRCCAANHRRRQAPLAVRRFAERFRPRYMRRHQR